MKPHNKTFISSEDMASKSTKKLSFWPPYIGLMPPSGNLSEYQHAMNLILPEIVVPSLHFEVIQGRQLTIFSRQVALSQKKCDIVPRLLLMTNRKSHKRFRLVTKSTTLDDLELHCTAQIVHLPELTTVIWKKIYPYYQQQNPEPGPETLLSGRLWIFMGVSWSCVGW